MTDKENEWLHKVFVEYVQSEVENINHKLKDSENYIEDFIKSIPDLVKKTTYKEDIAEIVDKMFEIESDKAFKELEIYVDEIIAKKYTKPMIRIWVLIGIVFAAQMFSLVWL